jgi:hypothetical protein
MFQYDEARRRTTQIVDDVRKGTPSEADDRAMQLVEIGMHALIDVAESLDSLNAHASEAMRRGRG